MAKVTQITADLALPFVEQAGCTLWDVEYVKEAGSYFLRVYIDKEGGVSIQDCEAVSRPLSDALDEADPIQDSYVLEVSSAGADRVLKKPEHLDRFIGEEVEIKFYKARDGRKSCVAILRGYTQDGRLTLEENGAQFTLEKQDVAQVRLYPRFS
jgi:ribosome maturation factor RimP